MGHTYTSFLDDDSMVIGGIGYLTDHEILTSLGVKKILSALPAPPKGLKAALEASSLDPATAFYVCPLAETIPDDVGYSTEIYRDMLRSLIFPAIAFLRLNATRGLKQLVHCDYGKMRSATIVVAYLMCFGTCPTAPTVLSLADAHKYLSLRRAKVDLSWYRIALSHLEELLATSTPEQLLLGVTPGSVIAPTFLPTPLWATHVTLLARRSSLAPLFDVLTFKDLIGRFLSCIGSAPLCRYCFLSEASAESHCNAGACLADSLVACPLETYKHRLSTFATIHSMVTPSTETLEEVCRRTMWFVYCIFSRTRIFNDAAPDANGSTGPTGCLGPDGLVGPQGPKGLNSFAGDALEQSMDFGESGKDCEPNMIAVRCLVAFLMDMLNFSFPDRLPWNSLAGDRPRAVPAMTPPSEMKPGRANAQSLRLFLNDSRMELARAPLSSCYYRLMKDFSESPAASMDPLSPGSPDATIFPPSSGSSSESRSLFPPKATAEVEPPHELLAVLPPKLSSSSRPSKRAEPFPSPSESRVPSLPKSSNTSKWPASPPPALEVQLPFRRGSARLSSVEGSVKSSSVEGSVKSCIDRLPQLCRKSDEPSEARPALPRAATFGPADSVDWASLSSPGSFDIETQYFSDLDSEETWSPNRRKNQAFWSKRPPAFPDKLVRLFQEFLN